MTIRYKVIGPVGWWRYKALKRGLFGFWWELSKSDSLTTIEDTIKLDASTAYYYNERGDRLKPAESTCEPNLI